VSHPKVGILSRTVALGAAALFLGATNAPPGTSAYSVGLQFIRGSYIRRLELTDLAVTGLSRLSAIDAAIQISLADPRMIEVLVTGTPVFRKRRPQANDPVRWGGLIEKAIEAARARSPILAKTDWAKIQEVVFSGFLEKLDASCSYIADARRFTDPPGGSAALGITFRQSDRGIEVISVFPESPAESAKLRPGDVITHLDSIPAGGWSPGEIRHHLIGAEGTELRLRVAPAGGSPPADVTIARQPVRPAQISSREEEGILYLRVPVMDKDVDRRVWQRIAPATTAHEVQGLILDLRSNGGGWRDEGIGLADVFLPKGRPIATMVYREDGEEHPAVGFRSDEVELGADIPLAVLINGETANASEIVAAALQENGRAVVIGSRSAGSDAVRRVFLLPGGAAITLTIGFLRTGTGLRLAPEGVLPDVCTSLGANDAEEVVSSLRSRREEGEIRGGTPPSDVAVCPSATNEDKLDVAVARMVLGDKNLYKEITSRRRAPSGLVPRQEKLPARR